MSEALEKKFNKDEIKKDFEGIDLSKIDAYFSNKKLSSFPEGAKAGGSGQGFFAAGSEKGENATRIIPPENLPVLEGGIKDYEAEIAKSWGVAEEKDVVLPADKPAADKKDVSAVGATIDAAEIETSGIELEKKNSDQLDKELEKLSVGQAEKEEISEKEILGKKEKLTEGAKAYAQSLFAGEKLEKVRSFFGNILGGGKSRGKDAIAKDIESARENLKKVLGEYLDGSNLGGQREKDLEKRAEIISAVIQIKKELFRLREEETIAKMGQPRRWVNEKAGQAFDWYQRLSPKKKIAVSVALFGAGAIGAVAGNVLVLSTAIAGGAAMRALGGAATVGAVDKLFDKLSGKLGKFLGEGNEEIFENKMFLIRYDINVKNLEAGKALDAYIDKSIKGNNREKIIKYTLAGVAGAIISSGAIGLAAKELFGMGMPTSSKGNISPESKFSTQPKLAVPEMKSTSVSGEVPTSSQSDMFNAENLFIDEPPATESSPGQALSSGQPRTPNIEKMLSPEPSIAEKVAGVKIGGQAPEFQMESPKMGGELHLEVGTRGPEGAIIDHFKTNPDLAKSYGWDGKGSVEGWAHRTWLSSVEGALKDPEVIKELTEHKFPLTPEGYAEAMTRLGRGIVELQPQGGMKLVDVDYLDRLSRAGSGGGHPGPAPAIEPPPPPPPPPGPELAKIAVDPAFQAMEKVKVGDLMLEYNDATRNQILSNNGSNLANLHSSLKDSMSPIGHDLAGTPLEMEKQAKAVEELKGLIKGRPELLPPNYEEMTFGELSIDLKKKGLIN